jgi:hypothetical protein
MPLTTLYYAQSGCFNIAGRIPTPPVVQREDGGVVTGAFSKVLGKQNGSDVGSAATMIVVGGLWTRICLWRLSVMPWWKINGACDPESNEAILKSRVQSQ